MTDEEFKVRASGPYYTIDRHILVRPDHVKVEDTIRNNTQQDLGVLVWNRFDPGPQKFEEHFLAGYKATGRRQGQASPSVFVGRKGLGFGLVPLDDVYVVQALLRAEPDFVGLGTETFGLAAKSSYTLEWAVYPNATGDYYDFINAVRRNEDRNGTFDGGFAFISKGPFNRRMVPSEEFVRLRNIKYGCIHCLSGAADDPQVSIEGIEFMDFPQERQLLKEQIAAIHEKYPNLKVMFHVAHSLYATNQPEATFSDSRVIDSEGQHAVYGGEDYYQNTGYFSKERVEQNWRWWIYYPTPGNTFHQALLKSADVMMDEIGCDGVFMDGFLWAYGGWYTYDRWDGHTVEVDPETQTIKRKLGSVLLLSQPSLVEFARKVRDKGGVVVANNSVITRTIAREKHILHDRECASGPDLHLAPTVTALTNPSYIHTEKDIYLDVLDKLKWGSLFLYYQEGDVTYNSLPAQEFPITFEEIRSGYVQGQERLITLHSGMYGWPGDRELHFGYHYDARGHPIPARFLTTVDSAGVRTEIILQESESAVLKRIPVSVRSEVPVNLLVEQYAEPGLQILMNGKGKAEVMVRDGDFPIQPGRLYRVQAQAGKGVTASKAGTLSVPVKLDGQLLLRVEPAQRP